MPELNGQQPQASVENFPLDEAMIEILAQIQGQFAELQKQVDAEAMKLNATRQGALVLFIRQHRLDGNWRLADNGRELVRDIAAAPVKETV